MATVKLFKSAGTVVLSNLVDHPIKDHSIFQQIAEYKPHTVIFHRCDGNAMFYYMHSSKFPTVNSVVYTGDYRIQDTDGLYSFKEVKVTDHFKPIHYGSSFKRMTDEENRVYQSMTTDLPHEVEQARHVMTPNNSHLYYSLINSNPKLEIV